MLAEVGLHGVVLGHSERRQLFGETDGALQLKVPAALEAGLVPILCVGETEEEREGGDTERKLRHQVQEGLEKVPVERLPEVVLAYEPIWAIGTGLTATPEQAQEAVAFVRALVEEIDKVRGPGGPDPLRRLAEARERRRSCSPSPTSTARSSAAPASTPTRSRASSRSRAGSPVSRRDNGPRRLPGDPRRLGAGARGAGQRSLARRHAGVRPALGGARPHHADRLRPERRAPGRADGQLGGRPPQSGCGRGRQAGPRAHRRGRRGRVAGRERGAARGAARRPARAPASGSSRRAACTRPTAT